jgi:TATA-binding protein-associated factor
VEFCANHHISQPPDKIVKNLCTFLCQDVDHTPTFAFHRKTLDGILSFRATSDGERNGKECTKEKDKAVDLSKADEATKAHLSRRGAKLAFENLSSNFGSRLFQVIPNMWQSMAGGILAAFEPGELVAD